MAVVDRVAFLVGDPHGGQHALQVVLGFEQLRLAGSLWGVEVPSARLFQYNRILLGLPMTFQKESKDSGLTVCTYPDIRDPNPFLSIVCSALGRSGTNVVPWDQRDSLTGIDVAFLHWYEDSWARFGRRPKTIYRGWSIRRDKLKDLRALRNSGTSICWVAHNHMPHEFAGSRNQWERRTRELFGQFDAVVHLTQASQDILAFERLSHLPSVVARHPHYDLVSPSEHRSKAGPIRRLLMLGAMTSRKNYLASIDLVLTASEAQIIVVGNPDQARIVDGLRNRKNNYPDRLEIVDKYLSEEDLHALFDGATAAFVNQPHALNSGVPYLAVSRGAPVICPSSPTNAELSSMIGHDWIRMGPIDASWVEDSIKVPIPSTLPDLSAFEPSSSASVLNNFFFHLTGR